ATDESVLDFGVGDAKENGTVEVHWPSGTKQRFEGIAVGNRYVVVEGDDEIWRRMEVPAQAQDAD
ncbi:ASPIC/UnbV domain-containing protein, partial [bacterium]|nr:ASPIC/UnbV domain-containing protein [bacterium]